MEATTALQPPAQLDSLSVNTNRITIEGNTSWALSDDVATRFSAAI